MGNSVALTLEARLRGRTLHIGGTTDLPNGAIIVFEVQHKDMIRRTDLPVDKLFADGNMVVHGGKYQAEVSLTGWPQGQVEVWVAFQTTVGTDLKQPQELIQRCGELGEFLRGANVVKAGALKRIPLTKTIVLTR